MTVLDEREDVQQSVVLVQVDVVREVWLFAVVRARHLSGTKVLH